jgi:hypothetical protein
MSDDVEQPDPTIKVRRDLTEIRQLAGHLHDQANHHAADRLMPGGRALVELGPVARADDVAERIEAAEHINASRYGEPNQIDLSHIEDQDDDQIALQQLLDWTDKWRADTGSTPAQHPTIADEAQWLTSALDWAVDNVNPADWRRFTADINRVRVRLENVLYAGTRQTRSQATCIDDDCDRQPRLVKQYGPTEQLDGWRCPACKTFYGREAFARAKLRHMSSRGAERFVLLQDARDVVTDKERKDGGRPERTFRQWMLDCRIVAYCDTTTRQTFVYWPDVRMLDLTTPRRDRPTL